MSEHIYKHVEVTGSSSKSSDDAIRNAIEKTSASVRELRWFEMVSLRGDINGGSVAHWQATIKIGFRIDD
ncbi:MAG: dodecin domain-containing protein [Planctomycetaceae bacterium]|nr:dodecin domain-containing protein [Planctomycetaceae bacterium]